MTQDKTTIDILNEIYRDMQLAHLRELYGEVGFDNVVTLAEARHRAAKRKRRETEDA